MIRDPRFVRLPRPNTPWPRQFVAVHPFIARSARVLSGRDGATTRK